MGEKTKKKGSISYAKWGYIFIAPFISHFRGIPAGPPGIHHLLQLL